MNTTCTAINILASWGIKLFLHVGCKNSTQMNSYFIKSVLLIYWEYQSFRKFHYAFFPTFMLPIFLLFSLLHQAPTLQLTTNKSFSFLTLWHSASFCFLALSAKVIKNSKEVKVWIIHATFIFIKTNLRTKKKNIVVKYSWHINY